MNHPTPPKWEDPDLAARMNAVKADQSPARRAIRFGNRKPKEDTPFDPPPLPEEFETATQPRGPNILQTLADALHDADTVRWKVRGIVNSAARHGDLQVALSALKRLEHAIRTLIAAEEA